MNTSYTNEESVLDDEFQGIFSHLNVVFFVVEFFLRCLLITLAKIRGTLGVCLFLTDIGILGIEFLAEIYFWFVFFCSCCCCCFMRDSVGYFKKWVNPHTP